MEQRIFKIDIGHIHSEDIEEYVKRIAEHFNSEVKFENGRFPNDIKATLINSNKMERQKVYECLDTERQYQDLRWTPRREKNNTPDESKAPAEWLNYIEFHMNEAKREIYMLNEEAALGHIRKISALGVRCLEIHGCPERVIPDELLNND